MFGRKHGANCDNHSYSPQMGIELRRVLTDRPEYLLGLHRLAVNKEGRATPPWHHQRDGFPYHLNHFHEQGAPPGCTVPTPAGAAAIGPRQASSILPCPSGEGPIFACRRWP